MPEPVTVIGGGSFGTAMAQLLAENGNDVLMWARSEESVREINEQHANSRFFPGIALNPKLRATSDLAAAARHSKLAFPVVPSKAMRGVMRELAPLLGSEHVLVHCTKGLEKDSFDTMSQVIREETCVRRIGAVAGPNLARELLEKKPAATVVGSKFVEVIDWVRKVLAGDRFLVYGNRDLLGVELGGTLKNILAIGAGVIDGGNLGANAKSLLLTRGLSEIMKIGTSLGAEPQTFMGLSGIGDIIATCTSPLSRNYQVGLRLGKGETLAAIKASMSQVSEGVDTTAVVYAYAAKKGIPLTLTKGLYHLMFSGASLEEVRSMAMRAAPVYEIDR